MQVSDTPGQQQLIRDGSVCDLLLQRAPFLTIDGDHNASVRRMGDARVKGDPVTVQAMKQQRVRNGDASSVGSRTNVPV